MAIVKEPTATKRPKKGKKPKALRVVDSFALYRQFKEHKPARIIIEEVGARPTDKRTAAFTFGMAYAAVIVAANACRDEWGCDVQFVRPQQWKRKFGLIGTSKDAARVLAVNKFPTLAAQLKRKKDHNRGDAVLIGAYT